MVYEKNYVLYVFAVWLPLLFFTSSGQATVIYDNCASYKSFGYSTNDVYDVSLLRWNITPTSVGTEVWTRKIVSYSLAGKTYTYGTCDIRDQSTFDNTPPSGPNPRPTLTRDQILNLIKSHLRGRTPINTNPTNSYYQHAIPSGVAGDRGGLDNLSGWTLTEASPAWAMFVEDPSDPYTIVPFIVNSAGDGDGLSFYLNGDLAWNAPLGDFVAGDLYAAVIPAPDPTLDGLPLLTMWLNSVGQPNASVFVANSWTVAKSDIPEPNAIWLLCIGLFGITLFRMNSVHRIKIKYADSTVPTFC